MLLNPPTPHAGATPEARGAAWQVFGVCLFLTAITFAVFGQTRSYEFVNYDDDAYVYENPVVQKGLTGEGFRWALTHGGIGHWHPLTWLSHMLDCQLYGLNAGGHHLTNVLLHTAAAILLFLVLRQMTGAVWRSAFVAAVFAIHPLRAESVAWVAERKDVLSAFFFMLTLGAYVGYVRHPSSKARYGAVVLLFALGLLSKNMLVTTPFVLLLLDYWPLNRFASFTPRAFGRLVAEKIPLFLLTVGSCVVTALVHEKTTDAQLPAGLRMGNAAVSYVTYIWQMIHPSGLACLYPNPTKSLPLWQVGGALAMLLVISGVVWASRKTHPYLVCGWLWYLGMMIPVIGIVQISFYAHADRYTYLPQIGLYLLLTWAAADLCVGRRHRHWILGGLAMVILMTLIFCARIQTACWRNSQTLWTHALACTSGNYTAHNDLGNALLSLGRVDDAIEQYRAALKINPDNAEACYNLFLNGRTDEAITRCQSALEINPNNPQAHNILGSALLQKGEVNEAITHFQKALQIEPDNAIAHNNLDYVLHLKERADKAITRYQKELQTDPDSPKALNNLAWLLATCPDARIRDGAQAVRHAGRACELTHYGVAPLVGTLAAAYAEAGRFDDAITAAEKACALAEAAGETGLLAKNRQLLALYRTRQPYREVAGQFIYVTP